MRQTNQDNIPQPLPRTRLVICWLEKLEQTLLTLLLSIMIFLASYQILLRWFTSGGLLWIDPLLRHLVLWTGMLGAAFATSRGSHIAIDAVSYVVSPKVNQWLKIAAHAFSAFVSIFLFRASLLFMGSEMEFGGTSLFGLPSWIWYLIFPIAFGLILVHFTFSVILSCGDAFSAQTYQPGSTRGNFDY